MLKTTCALILLYYVTWTSRIKIMVDAKEHHNNTKGDFELVC